MRYFLEKAVRIAAALKAPSQILLVAPTYYFNFLSARF